MKKEDEAAARTIIEPFNLLSILQAQDPFVGGRTDAIKLYHCVMIGEEVYYFDFTSIFPWTNKKCLHPVGHPIVLYEPEGPDPSSYFGLVKCKILQPYGFYHPVLSLKILRESNSVNRSGWTRLTGVSVWIFRFIADYGVRREQRLDYRLNPELELFEIGSY